MSSTNSGPAQTQTQNLQPLAGTFNADGTPAAVVGPGGVVVTRPFDPSSVAITGGVIGGAVAISQAKKTRALRRWYLSLGGRASAPCDSVFVGTSITTGYNVLALTQRWQKLLSDRIRSAYPVSGVAGGRGYFSAMQAILTPPDYPVVATGATFSNFDGLGAKCALLNGAGQKLVLTTGNVTSVDIFFGCNTITGVFSYKVDGGSSTNVDTHTGAGTNVFNSVRITGLGGTSHTIEVDWVSGAGALGAYVCGFMEYNGDETTGVRFWDAGRSSASTGTMLANTQWLGDFNKVQPSLVTIELGANDFAATPNQTAGQFKANLLTIINSIYAQCSVAPSIVLLPVWELQPQGGATVVDTWANFISAMYDVANADNGICVMNMADLIPKESITSTAGGLLPDTTHPGQAGSVIWADALYKFLLP